MYLDNAYVDYYYKNPVLNVIYKELYPITKDTVNCVKLERDLINFGYLHKTTIPKLLINSVLGSNQRYGWIKGNAYSLQASLEKAIREGVKDSAGNYIVDPRPFKADLGVNFTVEVNYSPVLVKIEDLFLDCITGFYFRR